MLTIDAKPSTKSEVVMTELDNEEAVLLHLDTKRYYSLNSTGLWVWKCFEENLTLAEIGERLQNEFDVTPAKAQESVLSLASKLHAEKLIDLADD